MVEGWICSTRLVKSPKSLFQDAPSQLAYLGIAMESGANRLPRRTGLCVLFHAHQLLIICIGPWTEWWSTRWIHGSWWKASRWWRCWCFGIGSQRNGRVTRRNGNVRCRLVTMSKMRVSVVNGGRCGCAITIRVVRIECIDKSVWGNRKRSGSWSVMCPGYWGIRRIGYFLSLLWLWVNGGWDPLLGANWNRNRVPGDFTSRWNARRIFWIRIRIRHENWAVSTDKIYGWMVPFHVSWRANGGGTKVWFRIFHHVGRDSSMCYQCWWRWRWRQRNECVQASWSHVFQTKILRRQRVLPFNGGLEKGKEPRQIVQMHQSPSQVVMESASLGVIHQKKVHHKKEGASEDWAKKLPKGAQGNASPQEREQKAQPRKESKKKPKQNRKTTQHMVVQAENPCFTLRWEVLMLNQELVWNCLEFLLGKPSAGIQMN